MEATPSNVLGYRAGESPNRFFLATNIPSGAKARDAFAAFAAP
jgi:hypothetical protein